MKNKTSVNEITAVLTFVTQTVRPVIAGRLFSAFPAPGCRTGGSSVRQHSGSLIPLLFSLPDAMSSMDEEEQDGPPPAKRSRTSAAFSATGDEDQDARFEVQDLWKVRLFSGACKTCKGTFSDPAYLLVHRPCYFGTEAYVNSVHDAPEGKQYGCKFCVKRFPSLEQIRQHIRFHLEKRYYCRFCEYRGSSQYDVKYHSESVHADQLPDYLKKKYPGRYSSSSSKAIRGRRPPSYTSSSGRTDVRPDALVPVSSSHQPSPSSSYNSAVNRSAARSLALITESQPSAERGFVNMKLDDIHGLDDFYSIIPFNEVCQTCSGMFDDHATYYAHEPCLQTNSQFVDGNYLCPICGRKFHTLSNLRMHCMYHGEKRFKCLKCSNAYHAIGEIKRHVPVHAELHPCGWPSCPKKFTTTDARQIHYDTAHVRRLPFVCELCSFGFLTKDLFQKHVNTRHAGNRNAATTPPASSSSTLAIEYNPLPAPTLRDYRIAPKDQKAMKSTSTISRPAITLSDSPVLRTHQLARFSQIPNETLDKHILFVYQKKKCDKCHQTFVDPTKHAAHEPCYHSSPWYRPNNPVMHRFGCPLCSRQAEKMGKLRDHMFTHFVNVIRCSICRSMLLSLRVARKHVAGHLESNNSCRIQCREEGCSLYFRTNEERLRHMEQTHRRMFFWLIVLVRPNLIPCHLLQSLGSVASLVDLPALSARAAAAVTSSSGIRTRSTAPIDEFEDERTRRIRESKKIAETLSMIKMIGDGSFIPYTENVISYIKIIASEESAR